MRRIILLLTIFPISMSQDQDTDCDAGYQCENGNDCPSFKTEREKLKQYQSRSNEYRKLLNKLKNRVCNKKLQKVCCEVEDDTSCEAGYQCEDTNNCQSYKVEREKLDQYQPRTTEYRNLKNKLRSQVCNKTLKKICCKVEDPQPDFTVRMNNESPSWIPSTDECGIPGGDAAFVYGGKEAKLGEFPWMVLLGSQRKSGTIDWTCGGALINKWFVLSAAHCGDSVDYVRLGEWEVVDPDQYERHNCSYYNEVSRQRCQDSSMCRSCKKKNGNIDCSNGVLKWNPAIHSCAPEHQDIKVDKVIIHPQYRKTKSRLVINDIMLLKLSKPADLNSYVQPICLPDLDLTELLGEPGHNFLNHGKAQVAGWGKTQNKTADKSTYIVATPKLQKLEVPVLSIQNCLQKIKDVGFDASEDLSLEEHLCAGGEYSRDSCNGDSGGPLMSRRDSLSSYMVVGVVSFGTSRCGIGVPGIYTRVSNYRQWIVKNLQ